MRVADLGEPGAVAERKEGIVRQFMGRRISKQVVNLGIGGRIERGGEELPPRSTVEFKAEALVSSIKHKFLEDGSVEEMTVLTVVADSFQVITIEPAAEQMKLPGAEPQPTTPEAVPGTIEIPPISGPLLVSCEACGHSRGDHEASADGEVFGSCLVNDCKCTGYVAFVVAPPEESLEPVEGAVVDAGGFVCGICGQQDCEGHDFQIPLGGQVGSQVEATAEVPA